jgi:hypothetical protein
MPDVQLSGCVGGAIKTQIASVVPRANEESNIRCIPLALFVSEKSATVKIITVGTR